MKLVNVVWCGAFKVMALLSTLWLTVALGQPANQGPEKLDTSWSTFDGKSSPATPGFGSLYTDMFGGDDLVRAMVVTPELGIILAGSCVSPTSNRAVFCAARYDSSGNLVAGFGNNGKLLAPISQNADQLHAAALQPDGKLVLGGSCSNGSFSTFCVARFNANGGFDPTFNGTGAVVTSIGATEDLVTAIALQPDGKIVVSGYCRNNGATRVNFCVARYNADGSLDNGFRGTGSVITTLGTTSNIESSATAIAIASNGSISLAGSCSDPVNNARFICVVRYNANGSLDTSFNSTGKLQVDVPGFNSETASTIALQPDGRMLIGGYYANDFLLVRLSASGALDPRFAPSSSFGAGILRASITGGDDVLTQIALQPDGKILAAGACNPNNVNRTEFCLARFHSDGNFDESFATGSVYGNGKLVITMGTGTTRLIDAADRIAAVAVLRDGRIMLGGSCSIGGNAQFCTARLLGSTFQRAWRNCTLDIDGDGRFTVNDSVISRRVADGLIDTDVTNGITFPPGAMRNTWASIRRHLIDNCGLSIR
ncbi:MAG: hypothetical protein ACRCWJ_12725 [Casimicrobium sp.]